MPKARPNRKKALSCPHCGKTFQRAQALGGHVRYVHADKLGLPTVVTTRQTTQTEEKRPPRETKPIAVTVTAGDGKRGTPVFNTGAHEHLATALEMLTQRSRQMRRSWHESKRCRPSKT
jgi:hypothetical protein